MRPAAELQWYPGRALGIAGCRGSRRVDGTVERGPVPARRLLIVGGGVAGFAMLRACASARLPGPSFVEASGGPARGGPGPEPPPATPSAPSVPWGCAGASAARHDRPASGVSQRSAAGSSAPSTRRPTGVRPTLRSAPVAARSSISSGPARPGGCVRQRRAAVAEADGKGSKLGFSRHRGRRRDDLVVERQRPLPACAPRCSARAATAGNAAALGGLAVRHREPRCPLLAV